MPRRIFSHCVSGILVAISLIIPAAGAQDVVRVSGSAEEIAGGDGQYLMQPRWSPTENTLAVTAARYSGIWLIDANGSSRQLTDEPAAGFGFSWSPDGAAILTRVARFEGPRRLNAVKVFNTDADTVMTLTDFSSRMPDLPQWVSPSRVMLKTGSRFRFVDIYDDLPEPSSGAAGAMSTSDNEIQKVEEASERSTTVSNEPGTVLNLVVSPDQSQVAFEVMAGNLFVMNTDGTDRIDLGRGNRPRWSPDGQWVVYTISEDDGHDYTASDLYAAQASNGERVQLTRTPDALEMNPDWSHDGRFIAFDDRGKIYRVPVAYE